LTGRRGAQLTPPISWPHPREAIAMQAKQQLTKTRAENAAWQTVKKVDICRRYGSGGEGYDFINRDESHIFRTVNGSKNL
jgi:hypothetical protein